MATNQRTEEPCEGKLSRTVLKANGEGDLSRLASETVDPRSDWSTMWARSATRTDRLPTHRLQLLSLSCGQLHVDHLSCLLPVKAARTMPN